MYQTILVPLDGSRRAEDILSHAMHIAKADKAKVVFLKVENEPIMLDRDEVIDNTGYHLKFENQREESLGYLDAVRTRFGHEDIQCDIRLVYGSVVKSILKIARDTRTDLIAMTTHGFSGLARVSYGSVAAGVLQAAEIPILLIRSGNDFSS